MTLGVIIANWCSEKTCVWCCWKAQELKSCRGRGEDGGEEEGGGGEEEE